MTFEFDLQGTENKRTGVVRSSQCCSVVLRSSGLLSPVIGSNVSGGRYGTTFVGCPIKFQFFSTFDPWRWDCHAVPKRRAPVTQWFGAMSGKNWNSKANTLVRIRGLITGELSYCEKSSVRLSYFFPQNKRPYPVIRFVLYTVYYPYGPGSSVSIATDYGLNGPGSNTCEDEIFRPSRPALGLP